MRVELNAVDSGTEPRMWVQHQPALMMALRTGSIEVGLRRSDMRRLTFGVGGMCLVPSHGETWLRTDDSHYLYLSVDISDAALAAACDGTKGDVELRRVGSMVDARVGALAAAVNAERVAGFSSGRLFLDSIEQALAVALVEGYAVRRRSVQTHRGGLGSARLRRIKEFDGAKIQGELTLCEMAQAVDLSTAHFSRMFRKSTGESPHLFLVRQRVERAKEMLRFADQSAPDPNPIAPAMVEAACSIGMPTFDSNNGRMMEGAGGASIIDVRVRDGRRLSVFRSYVFPYMDRPNVTVLTNAFVTKIALEGKRATGVEIAFDGKNPTHQGWMRSGSFVGRHAHAKGVDAVWHWRSG